jgi:hypothetical protein
MANPDTPAPLNPDECRPPTLEDVVNLCRALNEAGAHYIVVGGFAIRAAGLLRNTMDVDLLIETGVQNEERVIRAMMVLPDQAVREIKPGEIEKFGVIRVADEILVDLMKSGCGIAYAEAILETVWHEVEGVRIPFASPRLLWRMKQTHRAKDIPDRLFLRRLLEAEGVHLQPEPSTAGKSGTFQGWLRRLFSSRSH